jgi:hypothetical protein
VVKFTLNPGTTSTITIAVRAVVTDGPFDFLVGNIIVLTIGATLEFSQINSESSLHLLHGSWVGLNFPWPHSRQDQLMGNYAYIASCKVHKMAKAAIGRNGVTT